MENPISASNQCLSDHVYTVDGGAVKSHKSVNDAPPYIIGSKALKHFTHVPKNRDEARELFLTYVRTKMFYQMRIRDEDGKNPVHIPMQDIERRFFRRPRFNRKYELQWLSDSGELEITTKPTAQGFIMYYYQASRDGSIDFSLLKPNNNDLDDLALTMRNHLLNITLPDSAPSTDYFDTFLKLRYDYLNLFFFQDRFSGRIHTPVSSFHRTHRPNLLLHDELTVSFDVTTMQPLLLGKILKERIGKNEFSHWIDSGEDIYVKLQNKINLNSRDESKESFFEILFSKPNNALESMFGDSEWIKWVNGYKSKPLPDNPHTVEKEHSNLAWLLQTTEVEVMKKVWLQLAELKIPFLTVHDEIIVRESDATGADKIFRGILEKEFEFYRLNGKMAKVY